MKEIYTPDRTAINNYLTVTGRVNVEGKFTVDLSGGTET